MTRPIVYINIDMATTAKLFTNGGSQAVRLPKEFRFAGDEVVIRRHGRGVLLEPLEPRAWPDGYWANLPVIEPDEWQRPEDPVPAPIENERDSSDLA